MIIRRMTSREQNIFIVCILFVVGFFGYKGLIVPVKQQAQELENKIDLEQKALIKNQKIIQRSRALDVEYQEFKEKFKQERSNEQVMSAILSEIESVAGDLDLKISDLKPRIVNKFDNYNRFSVSLTIDSELVTILKFVHTLQQEPHFFNVDELRFDNNTQRNVSSIKSTLGLSKVLIP